MTVNEIELQLAQIFESVLEHKNFQLTDETTAKDVDGWDSVTHMMIISETEKVFKIKFELMELMNLNDIGDLKKCIAAKI